MENLLLIKLGGSLVTDKGKDKTARPEVICRLGKEIKSAIKALGGKVIVAHGAGSFAHRPAVKYKVRDGILGPLQLKGFPIVADLAVELNRIVIKEFLRLQLPAISFSPESLILSEDRKVKEIFTGPVEKALILGYLPVLYGDVVFDRKIGACIYSTEMVLGALAAKLGKKYRIRFIYVTDTDGVYDASGKTIEEINHKNINDVRGFITGSNKIDVTGGMIHKVMESLEMAKRDFETTIINGNRPQELKTAILGKRCHGTVIKN